MSIQPEEVKLPLKALKQEFKIGDMSVKNRIVMASLTRSRAVPEDVPNDFNVDYYRQRAAGGAGLILSEGTLVSAQGTEWPSVASIYSDEHAKGWKKVVDAVHAEGVPMFAQLWHVGRVAHPDMPLQKKFGKPVSAPSAIKARGGNFRLFVDRENKEPGRAHPHPWELVEEFRMAAYRARDAGFDGVEFHGANGYLAAQFADKNTNQRTDEWGGSVENRTRFYRECLDAICSVYPPSKVGIKLNPCGGYNDVGMNEQDTKETFGAIIEYCVKKGLAYVQLVRYLPFMDFEYAPGKFRAETHLDVLETFGPTILGSQGRTKLLYNGNVSAKEADELIEQGKIDGVTLGRSFINNPDLPKRLFEGKPLNEELGFPLQPKFFYSFLTKPSEGYSDYPDYEEAVKKSEEKKKESK